MTWMELLNAIRSTNEPITVALELTGRRGHCARAALLLAGLVPPAMAGMDEAQAMYILAVDAEVEFPRYARWWE